MGFLDNCFTLSGDTFVDVPFDVALRSIPLNMTVTADTGKSITFDTLLDLFRFAFNKGYMAGLQEVALGEVVVSLDADGKTVVCVYKNDEVIIPKVPKSNDGDVK
jgi:hypothetical protein